MAFVMNVLLLEPIVYCALFVKEDKTGTEESQVGSILFRTSSGTDGLLIRMY